MKLRTATALVSAALMGLSAPGFAQAARGHDGGSHTGSGSHFSGGSRSGGAQAGGGGGHWSGSGHSYGGGYRGGYRGGYGHRGGYGYGAAIGLGLLGAAIAAPYYSYPYAYAPAYPAPDYGNYFCRSYNAYYPQVTVCPEGWIVAP